MSLSEEPEYGEEEEHELTEEELAQMEEMDRKMEEAMALNAQLRSMVLDMEQQEQQQPPAAQRARQPVARRAPPAVKSVTGAAMRAPRVGQEGAGGWGGKTHTEDRANTIDRENAILVAKLSNIASKNRKSLVDGPVRHQKVSSQAINRNRKEMEIARQNAKMAARLASVKPTSGLSSKQAAKHSAEHQKNRALVSRNPGGIGSNGASLRLQPTSPIGALTGLHGLPAPAPRAAGGMMRMPSANSSRGGGSRGGPRGGDVKLMRLEGAWAS